MTALPVDFRACRERRCGTAPTPARCGPPTPASPPPPSCVSSTAARRGAHGRAARRHDCSGERAGNLYLQYWLYYEDSTSLRALPGRVGSHEDDWEGYQVRIGPGGTDARATSHHGYNYDGGVGAGSRTPGSSTARLGGRPPAACTYRAAATRATSTRTASRHREPAGPRPTVSPWSRSRPSIPPPAAPASRSSLPGASPSTAIPRIRRPTASCLLRLLLRPSRQHFRQLQDIEPGAVHLVFADSNHDCVWTR